MDQRTSHAAIASGDTMRLWCRCGQVEMEVRGAPIISAECLCASCRTAAEMMVALPGAPTLRSATGGTRMELFRKDRVRCLSGAAHLREFRLKETSKTRRVVATCCNTPIFLDFTEGHWIDLYDILWPPGTTPPLQMRTMASDLADASELPNDVPNHKTQSVGFFVQLLVAWAAMGFRRPKITYVAGKLDDI